MAEVVVAGVDWAQDTHEVLVADGMGERLWASTSRMTRQGCGQFCQAMVGWVWSWSRSSARTGCWSSGS